MRSATRWPAATRGRSPAFVDTVNGWLSQRARRASTARLGRLARLAEAWERINRRRATPKSYNLERKPLVFNVFGLLAEATRG